MTRKKSFLLAATLLIILLVACGGAAMSESAVFEEPMAAMDTADSGDFLTAEESMSDASFAGEGDFGVSTGNSDVNIQVTQERLIIRTANMHLVVSNTEEAMATISRMAEENGGWVVNSSLFQYNENTKTGNITIRVPSSGFNSALEALRGMAVEVRNESTSGQDVTEEYVDLSARLENLEATAARVRGFLDETETVEEALAVNQELSRLESEIEAMKGRLQFLSQSASFSTITVDLTPDVAAQPIDTSWRPAIVFRNAVDSLVEALQDVAEFGIWFVIYLLPLLLIVGVPLWLVGRFFWRRWGRRDGVQSETAASTE
ncbi:DUF4349 domain-containing protein [Candidatus Leptofilum sp.]|uniref:DUF4349 domain-containing protein n=1 Tax=Candidatus Leptofilum sp. TaxID=3241576 RepID=UPI003B5A7BF7